MSIETEITRISTNVSDTLSAVSEMGGEVPEGATSNDMAAGVRSIPVGAKIDDTTPSTSTTYSSSKIESKLTALNDANAALIEVSKTEPTAENTELWIHPNADEVQIPQINDSVESEQDTWSSKKIATEVSKKANDADLAVVAKSGSYNDLTGKPTIPTVPTTLPNPNALTFTGAVNETYDGSTAKSVAIPTVPESLKNPNKLTFTGAVTAEYDGSSEVSVEIPAGGGSGYELSVVTPEMYGAVGDGETDDTQALQSAIDSGKNVLLTGRYKVSEVKLSPYVTMTSSPLGRIVDGKVMMCPYSSIVGVVFEVTSGNTNNCIIDIGTYDATGVADSGGDNRYTIRDVKVVTNFSVKSNLDFVYIHVGDGELAHLFGIRITNVSIDGRLGKVFHFKAYLNSGNIADNGNGVWVNTVSIDNVWCGVPEYIVYTDYADPNDLKAQLDTPLRIGEVCMHHVTGEYSAYAKNDIFISFPTTISAMDVGFVDKGYTQDGNDPATAMYNIVQQPWYNSARTIVRTDCMDDRFFSYAKLANQNIAYINGSYTVDETTLYDTFLHDLSNNAYGIISSRTTDVPVDPRNMTLNLIKNMNDSRTLMGAPLWHRVVFRGNAEDGGTKFSLYFRSRPAVEYDDHVGCLYSDLYMPYGVSKAQLGDAYVPVIGSMVFNSATGLPMWYTGEKWVYADGTESGFESGEAVNWKSYNLPIASATQLGGVQPTVKTDEMTQAVGVDEAGGLWTMAGGVAGGKTLTKIVDLTIEEYSGFAITSDLYGNAISEESVVLFVNVPTNTDGSHDVGLTVNGKIIDGYGLSYKNGTNYCFMHHITICEEYMWTYAMTGTSGFNVNGINVTARTRVCAGHGTGNRIKRLQANNGGMPAGTTIKVYAWR